VQLPLELMLAHICFLSVLDTRKDVIGRVQHVVLVFLTERLGLQRMLIPFAQIRSSVCTSNQRCNPYLRLSRRCCCALRGFEKHFADSVAPFLLFLLTPQARNLGGDETSQGMVLGAPLRRPPAGWDIRNPQQSVSPHCFITWLVAHVFHLELAVSLMSV
jgi:hypothetical protein